MQKEPVGVITLIRVAMYQIIVGLQVFSIVEFTEDQFAYLVGGFVILIEAIMWLFTRSEVWAPAGSPTHPPTVAATKAEYEALFSAPGHADQPRPDDVQLI